MVDAENSKRIIFYKSPLILDEMKNYISKEHNWFITMLWRYKSPQNKI